MRSSFQPLWRPTNTEQVGLRNIPSSNILSPTDLYFFKPLDNFLEDSWYKKNVRIFAGAIWSSSMCPIYPTRQFRHQKYVDTNTKAIPLMQIIPSFINLCSFFSDREKRAREYSLSLLAMFIHQSADIGLWGWKDVPVLPPLVLSRCLQAGSAPTD